MDKSHERVRQLLADAVVISDGTEVEALRPVAPSGPAMAGEPEEEGFIAPPPWDEGEDGEAGPSDTDQKDVNFEVVKDCSRYDHSDTDNGKRLKAHFGQDLAVFKTDIVASVDYIVFAGDHWDAASGNDAVIRTAQQVGGRIALEADFLAMTVPEKALLAKAIKIRALPEKDWSEDDKSAVKAALAVPAALEARKARRRSFGVSSKNLGRIKAMLACGAPHMTRRPDEFNADAYLTAVKSHTLRFFKQDVEDLENPDPDGYRTKIVVGVEAIPGHLREHLITKLMPVDYDPKATCPKWLGFLEMCLPNADVRRCVQVFSGLGLTGVALQKVMFHYGKGANGKSVFMETLMQLFGPLGVGLPAASLVGEHTASGQQASPDIARLNGARIVRVAELPAGERVKEELMKILTGGEAMTARNLFKGFFEFTPRFKGHMSGNDYPRIDGTDEGIWRRMTVVHWPVTIPVEQRRDLHEVVGEFVAEGPGILNWLIEGVLEFLREGFVVPDEVQIATKQYRDEMDPIGEFVADCVEKCPGMNVPARVMYEAYVSWSMANAKRPWQETKFGLVMKNKLLKDDKSRIRQYLDCALHDVPARPDGSQDGPEMR